MRTRVLFSVVAALFAATALGSTSGAGTARQAKVAQIDVSTRAAVIHYLQSIRVNAKGVVIQRGLRNYAGAHCPGAGWSCTSTAHPVVQVAKAGGANIFTCATSKCAVVQVATAALAKPNNATCVKTTGLSQSCTISQSNTTADNTAAVYENALKSSGLTQTASSTASITQTNGSGNNTACVTQNITIDGSTTAKKGIPVTVSLAAQQSVTVKQDSLSGNNSAQEGAYSGGCDPSSSALTQSQTLTSTANGSGSITQNENAGSSSANVIIDIEQNQNTPSASGTNTATFSQNSNLNAVANTLAGPVSQTQSSSTGGLLGTVNQHSSGTSTASATQNETQCEDAHPPTAGTASSCDPATADPPAYGLTQTQFGPSHCCAIQGTAATDTFTISQTVTQNNDNGQHQTNNMGADCSTSGDCTAAQNTNIDGTPSSNTQTGQNINTQTDCTGSTCTTTCNDASCTSFTQSGSQLTALNTEIGEFGYGGMRGNAGGDGTGSITVSGVSGTVTKALLYWNGPTNSTDPNSNAVVSFAGQSVTGTNIGTASSNCWDPPYTNSQSYFADVTSLVSGNGTYSLANFIKTDESSNIVADINGVALIVFYNDGNPANWRNVVLWNGNDSNVNFDNSPKGWDEMLTGVPYPGSGSATLDFVVGDGQTAADGAISINGTEIVPADGLFQGDSTPHGTADAHGDLWDVKSFPLPSSVLTTGPNSLEVTSPVASDCLSLVAVAANMPASASSAPSSPQSQPASVGPSAPAPVSGPGVVHRH